VNSGAVRGANEDEFRRLNERLEDRARSTAAAGAFEVVCECDREECNARIPISFTEYEGVRAGPRTFIVVPGHNDLSCERVVMATDRYQVIEKFGAAGTVAEIRDPRDD
jgi:hypothetical protein